MEIHGSDKAESESEWAELTQECLLNILSRLDLHHLWTGAMFVCKSWLRASRDPSLHATLDLEPYFNSTTESARWWLPEFEKKIDSMLQSVIDLRGGPLTEIRTRHCSDRAINLASQRCPNLLVLSIKSCPNVTDDSISRIAFRCSNLTELDISYCYQISHQSLLLIGRNCPNLKIFKRNLMNCLHPSQHLGIVPIEYLNSFPQDGDTEAAIIGNNMPNLQYLEIQFSKLSAKGLASICNGCLKLEHLDLSGCSHLSVPDIANASSKLKNLKLIIKPKSQIPETMIHAERYGHWNLYDDRFRNDVFPI